MIVELETMKRTQPIDEAIERAAGNIFDATAGTADGVMVMPAIAEHEGRLAAIVEAERRLALRGEPLQGAIDRRTRDRRAGLIESRAELARREKAGLGAKDARDRLPGAGLVFGFHGEGVLRPSLKSLLATRAMLLRRSKATAPCMRQNALTGPIAPA